ncbi:hypothetical protein [Bifidobacterium thermophilum]|uniref:hypothetical protein n=1 Tax=Bifidobacterium thermophilum TaxID=33905 RepID=UPI003F926040
MIYTIAGFSQREAFNLTKTITRNGKTTILQVGCEDLVLLRWLVDSYHELPKKNINGTDYYHVDYETVLDDIPMFRESPRRIAARFDKMTQLGILTRPDTDADRQLYGFGPEYLRLLRES